MRSLTHNPAADFIEMLQQIAELYDRKLSQSTIELYWETLNGYSLELIRNAMLRHLKDAERGKFMPRPADIIDQMYKARRTGLGKALELPQEGQLSLSAAVDAGLIEPFWRGMN